jgi:transcriptional regulator with XRE-family HTH domain
MNNFSKRLKEVLESLRINQTEFAEPIGVAPSRISQWLNEELNLRPNTEQYGLIYKIYNVNINWLILGEGEMYHAKENANQVNEPISEYNKNEIQELKKQLLDCREETIKIYRQLNKKQISRPNVSHKKTKI